MLAAWIEQQIKDRGSHWTLGFTYSLRSHFTQRDHYCEITGESLSFMEE